jgi:hypothetical protein
MTLKLIINKTEAEKYFSKELVNLFTDTGKPITNIIGIDVFVSSEKIESILFDDKRIKSEQESLYDKERSLGCLAGATYGTKIYYPEDVKEAVKELKEELFDWVTCDEDRDAINFMLNKAFGDKLNGN